MNIHFRPIDTSGTYGDLKEGEVFYHPHWGRPSVFFMKVRDGETYKSLELDRGSILTSVANAPVQRVKANLILTPE